MGIPSQAELHAYTDDIASRMVLTLAAIRGEPTAKTVKSLFDLTDDSGDPAVQNALGTAALAVDAFALPENLKDAINSLTQRRDLQTYADALDTLARSTAGGSYADVRAALAAQSAVVHPLYAELERARRGESIFTSSSDVTAVAPPCYAAIRPTRVYIGTDGSWSDETTDAGSASTADVSPFASDDDKMLIGCDRPFVQLIAALSTVASADCVFTFKYWNGSAFTTLSVTDNSVGWTKNQNISWTLPTDWVRTYKDGSGNVLGDKARLYYIEVTRTANTLVTPPVVTCLSLIPTPILNGNSEHLGVPAACPQPPLALFRVTNTNTVSVEILHSVAYTRFKEPTSQLVLRALTAISANVTLTLAYTDQAGNATGSAAQSAWTSIAALGTQAVALTSTDGLRTVRSGSTVTTSATNGVFVLEVQDLRTPAQ